MLQQVLPAVERSAGPLLASSLAPSSPLKAFNFLGCSILAEVDATVSSRLAGCLSPGIPPAFHANYLAAQVC
jgi:hypothetical protein